MSGSMGDHHNNRSPSCAGMAQSFSFDLPGDPQAAVTKAGILVRQAGGTFSGGVDGGSFTGKTPVGEVKGNYRTAGNTVTVEITDKPFIVPKTTVESKIREFFGA